jgi:hypothetical protein
MTIYQGALYSVTLTLKSNVSQGPIDITGWTFKSQIRDAPTDEEFMIELTTENGGIVVLDGPAGQLALTITADQNRNFSLGNVVGDMFRTDADPGPIRLFGYRDKVRRSITREEAP